MCGILVVSLPIADAQGLEVISHTCQGPISERVDCGRVLPEMTWPLDTVDCPPLPPSKAMQAALRAARSVPLGANEASLSLPRIALSECGPGWVWVVTFLTEFSCNDDGENVEKPISVLVFMNGDTVVAGQKAPK
jgi:hypothetical protein